MNLYNDYQNLCSETPLAGLDAPLVWIRSLYEFAETVEQGGVHVHLPLLSLSQPWSWSLSHLVTHVWRGRQHTVLTADAFLIHVTPHEDDFVVLSTM